MTRQEKLNAFARSKGYPSYFAYRNAQAKAEGFSSYAEKRRFRSSNKSTGGTRTSLPSTAARARSVHPSIDATRDIRMRLREVSRNATTKAIEAAHITETRKRTQAVKDQLVRPVLGSIDDLDSEFRQFFSDDFRKLYASGAREANPQWKPSRGDVDFVKGLSDENFALLARNNEFARRSVRRTIPSLVDMPRPDAITIARRKPIKGMRYSNGAIHEFGEYGELTIRAAAARSYNMGFLKASEAAGRTVVLVSDGPDCGWSSHDDPELANGKIATIEEAQEFPIAHPNCVRSFSAAPESATPTDGLTRRVARAAGRAIAGTAKASAEATAYNLARGIVRDDRVREAARRVISSGRTDFLQFKQNLQTVAALYTHAQRTRISQMGNVTNLATRTPPAVSAQAVADDVVAWIEDFAAGEEVPEHVLQIIGIEKEAATRIAVGDRLNSFNTMYNSTFQGTGPVRFHPFKVRVPTKVVGDAPKSFGPRELVLNRIIPPNLTAREQVERFASRKFFEWLGPKIPQAKYLQMTFPNINQSIGILDRPRRLSASFGELVKVTSTSIKDRGIVNHLSLNPNGLLRLSFSRDPETGFITPTFRLIPHGPLHIMTKVNRGVKGNITSLSGEVRLITRAPLVGVSGRFNLNLRKLGLETLGDIKRLRLEDFLKFDRDDLRAVSLAADLRVRGWNIFDISRTFRIPWQEAEKLWALSEFELGEISSEIRAINSRKKLRVISGGRPTGGPPIPGGTTPRPLLRIVDPIQGDPFGPGGRPSFAQRIQVPSSVKGVPARRAYIETKLTSAERDRVAKLRLAGDYSTIRHLRNRDKLTWEQIAAEMNMSENKVRTIYKKGTR